MLSPAEFNRLRWRCRRGMLENDLILARFLALRGQGISAEEVAGLDRLLSLGDNELWDLLSGRQAAPDAALAPLLAVLRSVSACEEASAPDAPVSLTPSRSETS